MRQQNIYTVMSTAASRVLSSWHQATLHKLENNMKVQLLHEGSSHNLTKTMFATWRHMYTTRREKVESERKRQHSTLTLAFMTWKKVAMCSRADRKRNLTFCTNMLEMWKGQYACRKQVRRPQSTLVLLPSVGVCHLLGCTKVNCKLYIDLVEYINQQSMKVQQKAPIQPRQP